MDIGSTEAPTYMFRDLPKGTILNAEQMAAIGYGSPELKVAYKKQKEPKNFYPAPPHVYCAGCLDKQRVCWMTGLKVAERGGFFNTTSCHGYTSKGERCEGDIRNKLVYLAFVDENTAVTVTRGNSQIVVTFSNQSDAASASNQPQQPQVELSAERTAADPQETTQASAVSDAGLDVRADSPAGDITMLSAAEGDEHAAERAAWQAREAELVQQCHELTRRMAAVGSALVAKDRELATARAELDDERQRYAEEKDAWEADALLDNKVEDRAALLELMASMRRNLGAMRAAVGLSNAANEPAWRQTDGQIRFNTQTHRDRMHELEREKWQAERSQHFANAVTWATERAQLKVTIGDLRKEQELHNQDKVAWRAERKRYAASEAAWNAERQQLHDEGHAEHQRYASNEAAWSAERQRFAEDKASWDAERRTHANDKASWVAERQSTPSRGSKTSATLSAEVERHATTAAELDDKKKQLAELSATLDDERAQHASEEAAWSAERVQHSVVEASWEAEREKHVQERATWVTERAQHAKKEAAWTAERGNMTAKWNDAVQKEHANVAMWLAERAGYQRRIAELEACGAVQDNETLLGLLDVADRALVGVRAAVGPAAATPRPL
ncbi:uncharacterized protein LOC62_05G006792 [Vanrija pseudolonga]|uniref:Uncharacterized protein n=1 Tax=Vanrija pseudolonga TaxID=143232 RepID=A0AAF1BMC2_9TREE|nr:hypothetical protein LOC62_05G006792 [Vanrija pseudolonga]